MTVDGQKSMYKDTRWFAVASAAQHGRPKQRVEIDDVLADEMVELGSVSFGPEAVELDTGSPA